jgi:hypothetical protein
MVGLSRHHWKGDFSRTDLKNCTKIAPDLVQYLGNISPFTDFPKAGSRKPPGTRVGVSRHHWKGDFSRTDHKNCTKIAPDHVELTRNK